MELRNAWACGREEDYESAWPVHVDGTCNGLQHYAALGRDKRGGEAVNLMPYGKPQVSYLSVALLRQQTCLLRQHAVVHLMHCGLCKVCRLCKQVPSSLSSQMARKQGLLLSRPNARCMCCDVRA